MNVKEALDTPDFLDTCEKGGKGICSINTDCVNFCVCAAPEPEPATEKDQLLVLELFTGTGAVYKAVSAMWGLESFTVDINEETAGHVPDLVIDVLEMDYKALTTPNVIWGKEQSYRPDL